VSVPSIEVLSKNEGDLRREKFSLIQEFSKVTGSDWLLIANNFNDAVFDDRGIQKRLAGMLASPAFAFDGWFGIKYLGNMCSAAPFAYVTGIDTLIMGSAFEQEGERYTANEDGASPELSDAMGFAGISFAEQDELMTRRSRKVKNIIEWCNRRGRRVKIWTCFEDHSFQCGVCAKCMRTQLNILCAGENPRSWGFERFDEKRFSRRMRRYAYFERNACWVWDIVDSIDDTVTYPCCDKALHWLKKTGYKTYLKRAGLRERLARSLIIRLFMVHRWPRYIRKIWAKLR